MKGETLELWFLKLWNFEMLKLGNLKFLKFDTLKPWSFKTLRPRNFLFQVKESTATLNIPTPTPAPDHHLANTISHWGYELGLQTHDQTNPNKLTQTHWSTKNPQIILDLFQIPPYIPLTRRTLLMLKTSWFRTATLEGLRDKEQHGVTKLVELSVFFFVNTTPGIHQLEKTQYVSGVPRNSQLGMCTCWTQLPKKPAFQWGVHR